MIFRVILIVDGEEKYFDYASADEAMTFALSMLNHQGNKKTKQISMLIINNSIKEDGETNE